MIGKVKWLQKQYLGTHKPKDETREPKNKNVNIQFKKLLRLPTYEMHTHTHTQTF